MQPHFARQVRLYVAAAFLDTQLAFLRSLVHRASEQRLLLLVTRFAWDETSQRLTASTGELAAEQTQGAFSVMIPALQLTLVWARERKHGESDGEPEALTCKLVLPPVILAGGSAERVWDGLFGHADLQSIWGLHEQLVKAAEHVATIVETDAASVNDKVFAGRRWLALIANSKDLCDTCVCLTESLTCLRLRRACRGLVVLSILCPTVGDTCEIELLHGLLPFVVIIGIEDSTVEQLS